MSKSNNRLYVKPNLYNEYRPVIDFIAIQSSKAGTFVDASTIRLDDVLVPKIPNILVGSFDTINWFKVYINGVFIPANDYTYEIDNLDKTVTFHLTLPYEIEEEWELYINGKFINK